MLFSDGMNILVCKPLKLEFDVILGFSVQMALLPEGITELLHHEELPVPLVCVSKAYL